MNSRSWIGVLMVVVWSSTASGQQPAEAGRIKIASGSVFIVRANSTESAHIGDAVLETDTLRTGADGRLGVTLKDDTRVSLGPGSEVRIDRFAFAPASSQLGVVLNIARGVVAYVSGRVAKLSPDSVRLVTPAAVVGVRGTKLVFHVDPE